MPRYKLECNYGGLVITKEVEAKDEDEAFTMTGVTVDLEALGWTVEENECEYEITRARGR